MVGSGSRCASLLHLFSPRCEVIPEDDKDPTVIGTLTRADIRRPQASPGAWHDAGRNRERVRGERGRIPPRSLYLLTLLGVAFALVCTATAQQIGTDIAGLNLCLYGDCEARGTYAADPFGLANPGTLSVGMMMYLPHGVFVSGSYFRLNAGGIGMNIESPSITVGADPWVFQVNVVYADGGGGIRSLPGADLTLRTTIVRLATGADLGRTALGLTGLSVGLLAGVPGTSSDLQIASSGFTVVDSHESHEIGLTPGVDWHTGAHDWFSVGAFLNAERHHESTRSIDPSTYQPIQTFGTLNAWFARAGLSVLPFVPLGLAEESSPVSEFLREVRVASDVEYRNISSPGEPTRASQAGYFGADVRLLPDAWNPVSDYVRPYLIGGVDTNGGWGLGSGIYGNGVLEFISCNPAYSSRPLARSLADRVDIWAATCAVMVPF